MLEEWDRIDAARMSGKIGRARHNLNLWPRHHIKTWCQRARVIKYFLNDPATTVVWWHEVEDHAQDSGIAIAKQFQYNKALRRICPDKGMLPSMQAKRFVGAKGFRLNSAPHAGADSFRAWGVNTEATGGHSKVGVMDDIFGLTALEDNQQMKRKQWYGVTVQNVVAPDGWMDADGTRYHVEDPYSYWLKSPFWRSTVRAALEKDGAPDMQGEPVYFTWDQIKEKLAELSDAEFAAQMMNDPTPKGLMPWDPEKCEHSEGADYAKGPGTYVLLSDPAPAQIGSLDSAAAKVRGDGSKDDWAINLVKLRQKGQRREILWLDSVCSPTLTMKEGWREAARMILRHCGPVTARFAEERTGQSIALFDEEARKAFREVGVRYSPVELEGTYTGNAKNVYFGSLASRAKEDEFIILDSVPRTEVEKFKHQARNWRPMPGGKNGLRFDDQANCLSFATDAVFRGMYVPAEPQHESDWMRTRREQAESYRPEGRYIRF